MSIVPTSERLASLARLTQRVNASTNATPTDAELIQMLEARVEDLEHKILELAEQVRHLASVLSATRRELPRGGER